MTTGADIIAQALKMAGVVGVGQPAAAEDTADAGFHLNAMLSQWQRKRWLVWHLVDTAKVSTGAQSYTVGPGQDFDIDRPDRIEAAYVRQVIPSQPNQPDYPLRLIEAREDYARIALKSLSTWPEYLFYDSAFPNGRIYPWPVPQAAVFEIHILTKDVISQITNWGAALAMPPEYVAAIVWNLAARLRPAYQMPPDPSLVALAKDGLATIRGANAQIGKLRMPNSLGGRGRYNIFSDRTQ